MSTLKMWLSSLLMLTITALPVMAGSNDGKTAKEDASNAGSPVASPAAASPSLTPAAGDANVTALLGVLVTKGVLAPNEANAIRNAAPNAQFKALVDALSRKGIVSAAGSVGGGQSRRLNPRARLRLRRRCLLPPRRQLRLLRKSRRAPPIIPGDFAYPRVAHRHSQARRNDSRHQAWKRRQHEALWLLQSQRRLRHSLQRWRHFRQPGLATPAPAGRHCCRYSRPQPAGASQGPQLPHWYADGMGSEELGLHRHRSRGRRL